MCKKKMAEKEGAATDAVKSAEKPVSEGHAAHH
jgi:hypothetical protein